MDTLMFQEAKKMVEADGIEWVGIVPKEGRWQVQFSTKGKDYVLRSQRLKSRNFGTLKAVLATLQRLGITGDVVLTIPESKDYLSMQFE